MILNNKIIYSKTGEPFTFRSADVDDAAQMIEYLNQISLDTPYISMEPGEVKLSIEDEKSFVDRLKADDRSLMLVVLHGDEIIGAANVNPVSSKPRMRHRCSIGISLKKPFWNKGIGSEMMKTLIKTATDVGFEQMELEVVVENARALALYKKFGFEICGRHPHDMKYKDGTYADIFFMVKNL